MEKTGTGCLDLDEIMATADGQCMEGRKQPADLLAGKTVHVRKKEENTEGKEHKVALGRKTIFPFCKMFHAIKRDSCRLFQPFNTNVSHFIVHF